jgi:hypothetical protein
MKKYYFILLLIILMVIQVFIFSNNARTIHIIVALADNEHQGIVPVPSALGNGDDPSRNLYWGALYGVKTRFSDNKDWKLIESQKKINDVILSRLIFKHKKENIYLICDAYRGSEIKQAILDFLDYAAGKEIKNITLGIAMNEKIVAGGGAELIIYAGHNGLMDFNISKCPVLNKKNNKAVVILCCWSKEFFKENIEKAGAFPLLWTTERIAPEAYTIEAVTKAWIERKTNDDIQLEAVKAYSRFQKCTLDAAKKLLVTGF